MPKARVLFLCTHNSARSQMAEALLRAHAGDDLEVHSAGLEPTDVHPLTRRVLEERGLDVSGLYAKDIAAFLGRVHFGYQITVCDNAEAQCPIFPGVGQRLFWPFEDPVAFEGTPEERLAKFREVRDQIEARLLAWLKETAATAPSE